MSITVDNLYFLFLKNSTISRESENSEDEPLKELIIKDVRDFIEKVRSIKIKEIDECIDNLKLEREKFLPNVI